MSLSKIIKEKKVEYIELIYDLIFVYLIGRSTSLLDRVEAGFISFSTIIQYLASSLIFIQIWYYTTLFVNRYGKNGIRDSVMLMINMFLLYIMGATTGLGWDINYAAYAIAWSLILVNLAANYLLQLRNPEFCIKKHVRQNAALLLTQAFLVAASIPLYNVTGYIAGVWTMVLSFVAAPFLIRVPVNFGHLTERVMLYVVFTFGEMIITVAEYFMDGFSFKTFYYALNSFLIVAGLFFSYGFAYDKLLDREGEKEGNVYMLLHVFLIVALSFVTTSLEFLRETEIRDIPKTIMMLVSVMVYFTCLAMTEQWSKRRFLRRGRFASLLIAEFICFSIACLFFVGNGYVSIAIMVVFIYVQLGTMFLSEKHTEIRIKQLESSEVNGQTTAYKKCGEK